MNILGWAAMVAFGTNAAVREMLACETKLTLYKFYTSNKCQANNTFLLAV